MLYDDVCRWVSCSCCFRRMCLLHFQRLEFREECDILQGPESVKEKTMCTLETLRTTYLMMQGHIVKDQNSPF